MKKLLFILLLATFTNYSYSVTRLLMEDPEKENIDIIVKPTTEPDTDRSFVHVECFLNKITNALEIEYCGIQKPVVYVLDVNDKIVSVKSTEIMSGLIIVNLPSGEGCYRLIIQSGGYCGEGVVYIY